jgi:hypothetical protein
MDKQESRFPALPRILLYRHFSLFPDLHRPAGRVLTYRFEKITQHLAMKFLVA